MTDYDKSVLLRFIIRPGMYIGTVDDHNIVSFIYGYELGEKNECDFIQQLKKYFEDRLKIKYGSDGWPGQIGRYSKKKSISWVRAFKQIGLEILASKENGGMNEEMEDEIRRRLVSLIEKVAEKHPWFNEGWVEECNTFFSINSSWFKHLWSKKQYGILKSILLLIKTDQIFEDHKSFVPTARLLGLKNEFNNCKVAQ